MDYTKMTKQELIAELESHVHLRDAIQAKDGEISRLSKELRDSARDIREANDIKQRVKALSDENAGLINEIAELRSQPSIDGFKQQLGQYEQEYKKLAEKYNKIINVINPYVNMSRAFMKGVQANLELAVELEASLSEKLKG